MDEGRYRVNAPRSNLRLRRPDDELRMEIMPLIDVIFLLLTFFIFALVVLIRVDLVPMQVPVYGSGTPAEPVPAAVAISLDRDGQWFLDRQPIEIAELPDRLRAVLDEDPRTVIYLAADAEGSVDRLPAFLDLYDRLSGSGIELRLVGRPAAE